MIRAERPCQRIARRERAFNIGIHLGFAPARPRSSQSLSGEDHLHLLSSDILIFYFG
jgi:hypothetical protein